MFSHISYIDVCTNSGRVYLHHELIGEFVLNFEISAKVTTLPKVIKYVKSSTYSFHNFNANHMPSATLI